jgi:hypothetical protein
MRKSENRTCETSGSLQNNTWRYKYASIHFSYITFAQFDVFVRYALDDLQVPPWWCADWPHVWRAIVNKWFEPDWEAKHLERREWRLKMAGLAHHQGPINLREFGRRWVRFFISLFRFVVV